MYVTYIADKVYLCFLAVRGVDHVLFLLVRLNEVASWGTGHALDFKDNFHLTREDKIK